MPSPTFAEKLKKVRQNIAADRKKMNVLSAIEKARLRELREQKEAGLFLLPDAPERKQRRKPSPTRIPCPLMPGTPAIPPPRKRRHWEVKAEPSTRTDSTTSCVDVERPLRSSSSTSEAAEAVAVAAEVTPTSTTTGKGKIKRKPTPTRLLRPTSTDVQTAVEVDSMNSIADADFIIVDAEIDLIGFTATSSPDPADSAVDSTPTASTSSVPNEPYLFVDAEEEIAAWEGSIVENPGSDVEEEQPDVELGMDLPRQRIATEFPAHVDDLFEAELGEMHVLDARDDSALREYTSSEDMLHFKWQADPNCFTGEREAFTGSSGPTFTTDGMTPLDIFERIWDETIINLIVAETNRYANHLVVNSSGPQHSRIRRWKDISPADLWAFFGILMVQSFVINPVEKDYWTPRFPYLRLGNFRDFMPFHKFALIKRCLHFVDNSTHLANNSKLAKLSPVLNHLNRKFSSLYLPEQNIAIDESLLLWKGRLSFAQLIANKAARVGIKSYELCEARTGYLWQFEIYAGKEHVSQFGEGHDVERGADEPEGATSQIVNRLVRPLLNKGHTLVMDNFYNLPLLSKTLKAQKTDTIGTLRLNREFVPDSLRAKTKTNMRQGEIAFSYTADLSITVWRDSNLVSLISTYHKVEIGGAEKHGIFKYKPKVVMDYNLSMGGVDKKDQFLQAFPVERKRNLVWYKKLFRRLLNVSIHNAYVIYSNKKKIVHREFRMKLADEILQKYCPPQPAPAQTPAFGHFPVKVKGRGRCKQCSKRNVETRSPWACDTCGVRLCIRICFRDYHIS